MEKVNDICRELVHNQSSLRKDILEIKSKYDIKDWKYDPKTGDFKIKAHGHGRDILFTGELEGIKNGLSMNFPPKGMVA